MQEMMKAMMGGNVSEEEMAEMQSEFLRYESELGEFAANRLQRNPEMAQGMMGGMGGGLGGLGGMDFAGMMKNLGGMVGLPGFGGGSGGR